MAWSVASAHRYNAGHDPWFHPTIAARPHIRPASSDVGLMRSLRVASMPLMRRVNQRHAHAAALTDHAPCYLLPCIGFACMVRAPDLILDCFLFGITARRLPADDALGDECIE